jgi:hypothetical protein
LLLLQLLAELMNRVVVFVVNGSLGYLIGKSLVERRGRLVLAMLLYTIFGFIFQVIQLGLVEQELLRSGISILLAIVVGGPIFRWLLTMPTVVTKSPKKHQ